MPHVRTTIGLRMTIAVATSIALLGVVMGVALASIPASNGVINGCYSKTTGALRVVDGGKACARGERNLSWNQAGPPGPSALDALPCAVTGARGKVGASVDPATSVVTLMCEDQVSVSSGVPLTRIVIRSAMQPTRTKECDGSSSCSTRFPLLTPDVTVELAGSVPFHYTCPGQIAQANYFDVSHAITLGQCTLAPLSKDVAVTVTK